MLKQVGESGTVNPDGCEHWDAYVWINDIDTLFAHCEATVGSSNTSPVFKRNMT